MEPRRTASRCTMEAVTGAHTFEIEDYSQKTAIGVGNFIRSATFTVGGYDWAIRFYPLGFAPGTKQYAVVLLELMSSNAEVRVHYHIRYLGRNPEENDKMNWFSKSTSTCLLKSSDLTGGEFVPRHKGYISKFMLEQYYLHGDRVVIQCDLTVIRQSTMSENVAPTEIPVPPSDIVMHFGKLLKDKKGADIKFVVGEMEFPAHKAVLAARSPVFMEEFYGSMAGATATGSVTVDNMNPVIFRALLHFIYTDELPVWFDPIAYDYGVMIGHLLIAANRYAVDRLKMICQSILAKMVNKENVAGIVEFAQLTNCQHLKEACIEFTASLTERDAALVCATVTKSCPSFMSAVFDMRKKIWKE
ncbi:unnamed protein product [Urochloa humidicola]